MVLLDSRNGLLRLVCWMETGRPARLRGRPAEPAVAETGGGGCNGTGDDGEEPDREERFRRLFEDHFAEVCAFFRRQGAPVEEARDLTQEAFLRVYKSFGRFRGDASFRTWLFLIATNVWRNERRRRAAEKRDAREVSLQRVTEDGPALPDNRRLTGWSDPSGALDEMLSDERKRKLHEALQDLPPRMRRCVLLRIHGELKYREIAALMETSVDTVKSQLSQAQSRLERMLGKYFDPLDCLGDGET